MREYIQIRDELWHPSIYKRRVNRDRKPAFTKGKRTATETQHLQKKSEQRKKPCIYKRRANRDRNPTFTKGE
jgi:hypothetical protein